MSDMSYTYSLWSKNCISYWIRHISSILVWFRAIRFLFPSPFLSRSDLFIILFLYPSLVILSVLWVLFLISARVSEHVWIYLHTLVPTYFIFTGIIYQYYFTHHKLLVNLILHALHIVSNILVCSEFAFTGKGNWAGILKYSYNFLYS